MQEFIKLDLSFAKTVALHNQIETVNIDTFYQFQIFDQELQEDVLSTLSKETLSKFDLNHNLLPHVYMNKIQAKKKQRFKLHFTEVGKEHFDSIAKTLPKDLFKGKTIGFMWRYRSRGGAIKPLFMANEDTLRDKYSSILKQAINQYNCHVLVAGMKVKTTEKNRRVVDAKFPEYGLNFQHENLHYLPGKGWLSEVELISRCDIVICNPSGFSEAVFLKGKDCVVVDPPLHYVLKTIKNGFPLFGIGIKNLKQIVLVFRIVFQLQSEKHLLKKLKKLSIEVQ